MSNPAVERDSQKAALFGSLRASHSGCPSLLRSRTEHGISGFNEDIRAGVRVLGFTAANGLKRR